MAFSGSLGGSGSSTSKMWSAIQASSKWSVAPKDVEYRQFTQSGGRFQEKAVIPTLTPQDRIVPVIATQSGTGPEGKTLGEWRKDRMGAPIGFASKNPDTVVRYMGITSAYEQGRMDPNRKQLYGRLGDTGSRTLQMHPELYKSAPGWDPDINFTVDRSYSLINAPTRPGQGTPEGQRYTEILRKEISGANMVYDPLAASWGSRNSLRWFLNKLMTPGSVENESMLTGTSPSRIRESRERAAAQAMFKGYSPDLSWMLRLKQGQYQESGPTRDTSAPTISTWEGTQNLGELGVRDKGRA